MAEASTSCHQPKVCKVTATLARIVAILSLPLLAACVTTPQQSAAVGGYEGVQDGEFLIQPVRKSHLHGDNRRMEVDYAGTEEPGTIVVDIYMRKLYFVLEGGRAIRYPIAVGREGNAFRGNGVIGRKAEWPSWQPTANMVRTRPDLYAAYAGGLPGGLINPLGARALYLYRGGRDSMFRIHGTSETASIGHATSAGCVRLFNQDIIDLYNRTDSGTRVKVRTEAESLEMEGPRMFDAFEHVVKETPANLAQKEKDLVAIAKHEEKTRLAAEKAEAKRLAACEKQGIAAKDCPVPETGAATVTAGTSDSATSG